MKRYTGAEIAKMIREDLKKAYPNLTTTKLGGSPTYFKVSPRSKGHGVSSVRVEWVDFPSVREVEEIVDKYVTLYFDTSTDMIASYEGKTLNGEEFVGITTPDLYLELSEERNAYLEKLLEERGRSTNTADYYEAKAQLNNQIGFIPKGEEIKLQLPQQEETLDLINQAFKEVVQDMITKNKTQLAELLVNPENNDSDSELLDAISETIFVTFYAKNSKRKLFTTQLYNKLDTVGTVDLRNKQQIKLYIEDIMYQYTGGVETIVYHINSLLSTSDNQSATKGLLNKVLQNQTTAFVQTIVKLIEENLVEVNTGFERIADTGSKDIPVGKQAYSALEGIFNKELAKEGKGGSIATRKKEQDAITQKLITNIKENLATKITSSTPYNEHKSLQKLLYNTVFLSPKICADILQGTDLTEKDKKDILLSIERNVLHGHIAEQHLMSLLNKIVANHALYAKYVETNGNAEEILFKIVQENFTYEEFVNYSKQIVSLGVDSINKLSDGIVLLTDLLLGSIYSKLSEDKFAKEINRHILGNLKAKSKNRYKTYTMDEHKQRATTTFMAINQTKKDMVSLIGKLQSEQTVYDKFVNQHYVLNLHSTHYEEEFQKGNLKHSINPTYIRIDTYKVNNMSFLLSYDKITDEYQLENMYLCIKYNEKTFNVIYQAISNAEHITNKAASPRKEVQEARVVKETRLLHSLLTFHTLQQHEFELTQGKAVEKERAKKRLLRLQSVFTNENKFNASNFNYEVVSLSNGYIYLKPKGNNNGSQHYLFTDGQIYVLVVDSNGNMEHFTELFSTQQSALTTPMALKKLQQDVQTNKADKKVYNGIMQAIQLHKISIDLRRKID